MAIYGSNITEDDQAQIICELGERLKNIREAQNLSISEISEVTKIQKRYLEAIESGNLSALPRGPYTRGFIRQYCEFLSAADLWNSYDRLTAAPQNQDTETTDQEQDYIAKPTVFKATSHWWILLVVIVSFSAAGWITWNYRGEITGLATSPSSGGTAAASKDRQNQIEAGVSADGAVSIDVSADAPVSANLRWMDGESRTNPAQTAVVSAAPGAQESTATIPTGKDVLRISASSNCWMLATSGGKTLFSGTLRSGESQTFTVADSNVRVKFGNPSGVSVTWNGKTVKPLGPGTKPITKIFSKGGGEVTE